MSTFTTDDNQSHPDLEAAPEGLRDYVKRLEREKREAETKAADVPKLQKQIALNEAGLSDLSKEQREALFAVHKGESTPEEIRKTAELLKFAEPKPEPADLDQAAHQQIANAQTGAAGTNQQLSYEQEMATANTREEVIAIAQKHGQPIASE